MVSSVILFAADPVDCGVAFPCIGFVCPENPMGAQVNWDLGNLEAKSEVSRSLPARS